MQSRLAWFSQSICLSLQSTKFWDYSHVSALLFPFYFTCQFSSGDDQGTLIFKSILKKIYLSKTVNKIDIKYASNTIKGNFNHSRLTEIPVSISLQITCLLYSVWQLKSHFPSFRVACGFLGYRVHLCHNLLESIITGSKQCLFPQDSVVKYTSS